MANGYSKIVGASSGGLLFSQYSLWSGPDHLLQIEKDSFTERYQRFYFADIETFTIRLTNRQRNYTILFLVILALLSWAVIMSTGFGRSFGIFWFIFFTIPFVINLVKGPSCVTHLTTAVKQRELSSLRRLRRAERALKEVLDRSVTTQGLLSAEETRVRFQLAGVAPLPTPPPISVPPLAPPPPPPSPTELPPPV